MGNAYVFLSFSKFDLVMSYGQCVGVTIDSNACTSDDEKKDNPFRTHEVIILRYECFA